MTLSLMYMLSLVTCVNDVWKKKTCFRSRESLYLCKNSQISATRETKAPVATKLAKAFLALNLKEEPEFKTKVQEMKKRPKKGQQISPRVIYVGHLPTGLFEPQIKSYIEQFGNVVRLQLARSKTTGGVRLIVTKIVAETMNNYLMGEILIKCNQVPTEVHEELFVGSQRAFKKLWLATTRHTRGGQGDDRTTPT